MSTPKKSPYVWSPIAPTRAGRYWYRCTEDCEEEIVEIFTEEGENEPSVRFLEEYDKRVNWVCNESEDAQWAGPIPGPREPGA